MKDNRKRAKRVRQRKVAALASYSRKHSVNNCTIPKIENGGTGEWKIPEEGYKQPKTLRKKYKKKYYFKGSTIVRKVIAHSSDYDQFPDHTFRPKGIAWFMEQVVQHKIAKWEKKNPCPIKKDDLQQDLFEEEYMIPWKARREDALKHIRDVVVSMYDKLPLTGRFEKSENDFKEELVAEIKDRECEAVNINSLNPKTSPLLRKAQKITNGVKAKRTNLVCTNLKDHKHKTGRIILPKAA